MRPMMSAIRGSSARSAAFLTRLELGLPISAIEQLDLVLLGFEIEIVETTNVYDVKLGVRAWTAKGVNTAMFAKKCFANSVLNR